MFLKVKIEIPFIQDCLIIDTHCLSVNECFKLGKLLRAAVQLTGSFSGSVCQQSHCKALISESRPVHVSYIKLVWLL